MYTYIHTQRSPLPEHDAVRVAQDFGDSPQQTDIAQSCYRAMSAVSHKAFG